MTVKVVLPERADDLLDDRSVKPTETRTSNGSGFIFDGEGHVVTNAHVVERATRIEIVLSDGQRRTAVVVGTDAVADIAVLAVEGDLPIPLRLSQGGPRVGLAAFAVGSPLGLSGTVSSGIVSGMRRALRPTSPDWMIQHTAMINPGSSGGPLLDRQGRVLGVNTALPDGQFQYAGIGFAIDAAAVWTIARQIIRDGPVVRPELGATFRAVDDDLASALALASSQGLVVESVQPDSAATRAGLMSGDHIVALNDRSVASLSAFTRLLALEDGTRSLKLSVRRRDRALVFTVPYANGSAAAFISGPAPRPPIGIRVAEKGPAVITGIDPGSLADQAGLQAGDRIWAIGQVDVATVDQILAQLTRSPSDPPIALTISRGEALTRIVVLGAEPSGAEGLGGNSVGPLSASL